MACCIVFAKLLMWVYRLFGRRGVSESVPRSLLRSAVTRRLLLVSALGELLVVVALIWVISPGTNTHQTDMAMAGNAPDNQRGWQWAVPAIIGLAALSTASTLMDGRMTRRALAVLAGGAAAAAAVSPPVLQGARSSHFVFMTQLELLAVVAPILIVLGIRRRWRGTAVGEALGHLAPAAAVASVVTVTVIHLPRVHAAMTTSAVLQACALLAVSGTGALVWLAVLADPSAEGALRRLASALVSQEAMAIIGLVLLLSPQVLFATHQMRPAGMDPMLDQRTAGAVALAVDLLVTVPVLIRLATRVPTSRPIFTDDSARWK
jgi:cytochrome c oxidase assembly factor CtaG